MTVLDATVLDERCMLCDQPWIGCLCAGVVDDLSVAMRRAVESGDLAGAAEIASEIEQRGAGRH